jgi:hypothetical protein
VCKFPNEVVVVTCVKNSKGYTTGVAPSLRRIFWTGASHNR